MAGLGFGADRATTPLTIEQLLATARAKRAAALKDAPTLEQALAGLPGALGSYIAGSASDPTSITSVWNRIKSEVGSDPEVQDAIYDPVGLNPESEQAMLGDNPNWLRRLGVGAPSTVSKVADLAASPLTRFLPAAIATGADVAGAVANNPGVRDAVKGGAQFAMGPEMLGFGPQMRVPSAGDVRASTRLAADRALPAVLDTAGKLDGLRADIPGGAGPALPAGAYGARRAGGARPPALLPTGDALVREETLLRKAQDLRTLILAKTQRIGLRAAAGDAEISGWDRDARAFETAALSGRPVSTFAARQKQRVQGVDNLIRSRLEANRAANPPTEIVQIPDTAWTPWTEADRRPGGVSEPPASYDAPPPRRRGQGVVPPAGQGVARHFDEHLLAQPTRGTKGRGLAGLGFRQMSDADALEAARSGQHLFRDPDTGKYIGAPDWVDTPRKLQIMRHLFDMRIEGGAGGADWYDRARAFVSELANGDPVQERYISQSLGLFSPQADPMTNLGSSVQAHNERLVLGGRPEKVRTGAQAAKFNAMVDSMERPPTPPGEPGIGHNQPPEPIDPYVTDPSQIQNAPIGKKVGVYADKLDPTRPPSAHAVNDSWHMRNFSYSNPDGSMFSGTVTPQMRDFVLAETMLAADRANARGTGGRNDWNSATVQAAPWIEAKADGLVRRSGGRMSKAEAVAEAAKTYPEYALNYTGSATHEKMPGAPSSGLRHMSGLHQMPQDAREAILDQMPDWQGPGGQDLLYGPHGARFLTRPTAEGMGSYTPAGGKPETNKVQVGRPMIGRASGAFGPPEDVGKVLNAVELLRAVTDAQNAGTLSYTRKVGGPVKARDANAAEFPLNRGLTRDEMLALQGRFNPLSFIDTAGDGVRVADFSGSNLTGAQIAKRLADPANADVMPAGAGAPQRVQMGSVYHDLSDPNAAVGWGKPGSITPELQRLWSDPAVATAFRHIDTSPEIRARVYQKLMADSRIATENPRVGPTDKRVQNFRAAFQAGGLRGVFEAYARGVPMPAVLMAGVAGLAQHLATGSVSAGTPDDPVQLSY